MFEYATIQEAAQRLGCSPEALCVRCRRGAKKAGEDIVAALFDGIVAYKWGDLNSNDDCAIKQPVF